MSVDQKKIDEALATLREAGYAVKVWTDEDINHVINDLVENAGAVIRDEAHRAEVISEVMASREWGALEECSDWEWELIAYAVEDELENLGKE